MQYRKADRTFHLTGDDSPLSDISESGARLFLTREYKVGDAVTLDLASASQKLSLKSKIIRSAVMAGGKFDIGIHYDGLTADQGNILKAMIESFGRGVPLKAQLLP